MGCIHFKSFLLYMFYLLENTNDYNNFFEQLLLKHDYEPESILVDFECATLKSTKLMFPDAVQIGIFFDEVFFSIKNYFYYKYRMSFSLWTVFVERDSIIRSSKQVHK